MVLDTEAVNGNKHAMHLRRPRARVPAERIVPITNRGNPEEASPNTAIGTVLTATTEYESFMHLLTAENRECSESPHEVGLPQIRAFVTQDPAEPIVGAA